MHWQTMAMCDGFITDALIRLSRACADAHADPRVNEALPDDPDGFKNVLRADMEREDEEKAEKAARENVKKKTTAAAAAAAAATTAGRSRRARTRPACAR